MKTKKINGVYTFKEDSTTIINKSKGENLIKADMILSAWQNYCRESKVYRLFEFFGLR